MPAVATIPPKTTGKVPTDLLDYDPNNPRLTEDARKSNGKTPLMCAASNGHSDVAAALIGKAADVNARNRDGNTALALAARNGHADVAELHRQAAPLTPEKLVRFIEQIPGAKGTAPGPT